jgi:hypothetical protein
MPKRSRRNAVRLAPLLPLALAMALALLAGCADDAEKFPPVCPALSLLRDAADLTRYQGGHDLTNLLTDARIEAVPARCERGGPGIVRATLDVTIDLTRGPAAQGRRLDVPYFVAVTRDDAVLDEQDYQIGVTLPANVDQTRVTSDDIVLNLPVTRTQTAAAYHIYVGFRLTSEELETNRARGPR